MTPRPARFDPETPPPGFEKRLVSFWRDRPLIHPRLQLVHTNAASREGSIEASFNWANQPGSGNTIPHFQVDRSGRAAMLLPLNRKGIANYKAADFSIGIETADRGMTVDPSPACSWFTDAQAESVAIALAYAAWGYNIPLVYPSRWDGSGTACHTEPFGYPWWTNASGKTCPGDRKKAQMKSVVLPRARQILAGWTGTQPSPEEDPVFIVRVRETGTIWVSNLTTRYPFPSWDTYQAAVFVAKAQGRPLPDFVDIDAAQLPGFGVAIGG